MKTWLLLLLLVAPSVALACPVCGTAPERSREAYQYMTAVMTFLPLTVLGGLFVAFLKRARRAELKDQLELRRPPDA